MSKGDAIMLNLKSKIFGIFGQKKPTENTEPFREEQVLCEQAGTNEPKKQEILIIPESFGELERYVHKVALWFESVWNGNFQCTVESNNEDYYVKDGAIYNRSRNRLELVLPLRQETYMFPQNIKGIGYEVLKFCDVKKVVIPETYSGSIHQWGCKIERLVVKGPVTSVDVQAFADNERLHSVVFSDHPLRIGENAFRGCTGLSELVLPSYHNLDIVNTESIDRQPAYKDGPAFCDCVNIRTLNVGSLVEEWDAATETLIIRGSGAFYGSVFGRDFYVSPKKVVIGGGITSINNILGPINSFGIRLSRRRQKDQLTTLILEEGIEKIGYHAFAGCEHLEVVQFPKSLKRIEEKAFYDCIALSVPDLSDVSVGLQAFWGCKNAPYIAEDYEKTIFCGQSKVFVNSDGKNYYDDYKKAISLLNDFCHKRILRNVRLRQDKNSVSAIWSNTSTHYHDGYEYSQGAMISIERISLEEYLEVAKKIPIEEITSKFGYIAGTYKAVQNNSEEFFLVEIKEDSDRCELKFYCKTLMGIIGYFRIQEVHWDTM